jgi:hypothetical protein
MVDDARFIERDREFNRARQAERRATIKPNMACFTALQEL